MGSKKIKELTLATAISMVLISSANAAWVAVESSESVPTIALGGTVIPYKEVTLSAQMPGRITYLAGKEGMRFQKGVDLIRIDDAELLAKRGALLAQHESAKANYDNAIVQANRNQYSPRSETPMPGMEPMGLMGKMFPDVGTNSSITKQADAFDFKIKIRQARSAIFQAEAGLRALDVNLRNTRSIAPFDGVIMQKFIEQDDTVQPGMPLLKFADPQYLQVSIDVPARIRAGLKEGMMLNAEFDGSPEIVEVRVAQIFPMADAERHTIKVKFDIPRGVSSPGMYAKVSVPDSAGATTKDALIPTASISYNGSLPAVYVKGSGDKPELRLIRVGETTEKNGKSKTVIIAGLSAGDTVWDNAKTINSIK